MKNRKNIMMRMVLVLALICVAVLAGRNEASAKGSDGVIRFQPNTRGTVAVQVGDKIYYTTERAGYIYTYDIKKKNNKKLAKIPKEVRDKNSVYYYKNYSSISSMFYYKGNLYCEVSDKDLCMSYGIIRVNVKTGKVKKLFYEKCSGNNIPKTGLQFSIYNDKIYYAYSDGSLWETGGKEENKIDCYFASMDLNGNHKKVIAHKELTKLYRNAYRFEMYVYEDALYVQITNKKGNSVNYKYGKNGKKTKIKKLANPYTNMKVSTSGCVYGIEKGLSDVLAIQNIQYKGNEYQAGVYGLYKIKDSLTEKTIYYKNDKMTSSRYVMLGDYILVSERYDTNKKYVCKEKVFLIDINGKKKASLYTKTLNYNDEW